MAGFGRPLTECLHRVRSTLLTLAESVQACDLPDRLTPQSIRDRAADALKDIGRGTQVFRLLEDIRDNAERSLREENNREEELEG